jgi:phenylalanine-4-hydroxylase
MPATLTIHSEKALVYSAFHGDVSEEEFLQNSETIRSHPNFDPSFSEIVDLRGVTELHASDDSLRQLAERESLFHRDSKHLVIAEPGLISRLARMFQELAEETRPHLKVVRAPEEAFDYLKEA